MFVWECIKQNGKNLGTCMDGFLFGSCCQLEPSNEITKIWSSSSSASPFHFITSTTESNLKIQTSYPKVTTPTSYPKVTTPTSSGLSTLAWPDLGTEGSNFSSPSPSTKRPTQSPTPSTSKLPTQTMIIKTSTPAMTPSTSTTTTTTTTTTSTTASPVTHRPISSTYPSSNSSTSEPTKPAIPSTTSIPVTNRPNNSTSTSTPPQESPLQSNVKKPMKPSSPLSSPSNGEALSGKFYQKSCTILFINIFILIYTQSVDEEDSARKQGSSEEPSQSSLSGHGWSLLGSGRRMPSYINAGLPYSTTTGPSLQHIVLKSMLIFFQTHFKIFYFFLVSHPQISCLDLESTM